MTSSNGSIFRDAGHMCEECIDHRLIPRTKANGAELFMFSLICTWINSWVNNRNAGDLRRNRAHYDVPVMYVIHYTGIISDVNSMFYFRVTTEALACIEVALEGCTEQELTNMGMYDTYTKLQKMVVDYGCWRNKLVLIYHVLRVLLQIKFLLMNMA